jgi:protein ImuB
MKSQQLYACVYATEFPAQSLLRLRTDWQTEAVVVMDGSAPQEWVCSMNRLAERKGAAAGMTRLEAEGIANLRLLKRSVESETAARAVFLECAAKFSPRIEDASEFDAATETRTMGTSRGTSCALVLDITGTELLFGPPQRLVERLREELVEAGFRVSVAVSANYEAARMKAAGIHGIAVIPEGAEADALAKMPIAAMGLDEERTATLMLWGINTLSELAALPEAELVARLGPEARRWHALARGTADHAFVPIEPAFNLEEFCEFETPVEQIDSLLFVGARMIDCLVSRAAGRALALTTLKAEMRLEGGGTHSGAIRPALPSTDRKFLLKLLQLEIGTHPPQAAVTALTLRAEAGQQSKVQLGLFTPQTPEPSRLDVTLARLRALVGEECVGSPMLEDTHRAGAFRMDSFSVSEERVSKAASQRVSRSARQHVSEAANQRVNMSAGQLVGDPTPGAKTITRRECGTRDVLVDDGPRMALRRVRPARVVRVLVSPAISSKAPTIEARAVPGPKIGTRGTQRSVLKPVSFRDGEHTYAIDTAYGPWRTSGCWWALPSFDGAWDTEEWDVLAVPVDKLSAGSNIKFADEKQLQILRLRPAARVFAQDDKQKTVEVTNNGAVIACLLVHDRTSNAWRLEAFYD